MLTEDDIWAALSEVIHPTYGMSLVTLQMVQEVRVASNQIAVDLLMNCPGCPAGKVALAKAKRAIDSLYPSGNLRVEIYVLPKVWNPPWQTLV